MTGSYDVAVDQAEELEQEEADRSDGIYAGQGLTGQRAGAVVTGLVMPVLLLLPGALTLAGRAGGKDFAVLAFLAPALTYLSLSLTLSTRHPETRGSLLTTRCLTGRRTIDLAKLRRVRRMYVQGKGGHDDWLFLTDDTGVRLRLQRFGKDRDKLYDLVRPAIGPGVDVSPNAADLLGLSGGRRHEGCLALLLPFLIAFGVVALSIALAGFSYLIAVSV